MQKQTNETRWESHADQVARWPREGRHILAQYDADTVIVYQAYRPSIAAAAVADGRLGGGGYSFTRMSWLKPNFLWMMYRSGWASKPGQEHILAIRLLRTGFDSLLREAVHSSYVAEIYGEPAEWKRRVASSDVRLQWDPDHSPCGAKQLRRAVQLGMRGETLHAFATAWTVEIADVTERVRAEAARRGAAELQTPRETVYPVGDPATRAHLGLTTWPTGGAASKEA